MKTNRELPILDERKSSSRQVNRREWLRRMLGGVTAGFAFPGLAASHPVHKYLADGSTLNLAEAQGAISGWTPKVLDAHQAATLAVLAERIVPGSSSAQVERFIDSLLSVESREDQQGFLNSLAAMEGESLQRYSHSFKDLTGTQQDEILTAASTVESGHGEHHGGNALGQLDPTSAQEHDTLRDQFENLKGWAVGAYYSSEVGMRELGWTGEVAFESFPGCQHPGGHS